MVNSKIFCILVSLSLLKIEDISNQRAIVVIEIQYISIGDFNPRWFPFRFVLIFECAKSVGFI